MLILWIFQACCSNKIVKRPEDGAHSCCGKELIDRCTEFCCEEKDVHSFKETNCTKGCCCGKTYDKRQQCCCNDVINEMPDTGICHCCGDLAYDYTKQKCCGSTLHDYPLPYRSYCCGEDLVTYSVTKCCRFFSDKTGWHYGVANAGEACCGTIGYNTQTHLCCSPGDGIPGRLLVQNRAGTLKCCLGRSYDSKYKLCCEDTGNIIPKRSHNQDSCCGDRYAYVSSLYVCCNGKIYTRRRFNDCCGTKPYNRDKYLCCEGNLISRVYGIYTKCCGTEVIHFHRDVCCHSHDYYRPYSYYQGYNRDPIVPIESKIASRSDAEDIREAINIGSVPVKAKCQSWDGQTTVTGEHLECPEYESEEAAYKESQERSLSKPFDADDHYIPYYYWGYYGRSCCVETPYSVADYKCCAGILRPRPYGRYTMCCGTAIYNSLEEICCCNRVYPKSTYTSCCSCKPYNNGNEICCCGGRILPRDYGRSTRCCGTTSYDASSQGCCCGRVHNRSMNNADLSSCCGATPMDPSIHSCCYPSQVLCRRGQQLCCGGKCYNTATEKCCYRKVIPINDDCVQPFYITRV